MQKQFENEINYLRACVCVVQIQLIRWTSLENGRILICKQQQNITMDSCCCAQDLFSIFSFNLLFVLFLCVFCLVNNSRFNT